MLKRLLILGLVMALMAALVGPAAAGKKKKKKKGPKPYTSEEGSILIGHPAFHSASEGSLVSVTAQEFFASCDIPTTNGVDAFVYEAPAEWAKFEGLIKAVGSGAASGIYDVDIYLYDEDCSLLGASNVAGTDETGYYPVGVGYVLIHNYSGDPVNVHYELTPRT